MATLSMPMAGHDAVHVAAKLCSFAKGAQYLHTLTVQFPDGMWYCFSRLDVQYSCAH